MSEPKPKECNAQQFATTHWSLVLRAGGFGDASSAEALDKLCRAYWFPLYAFARREGSTPEDAQDLTQEFFSRLLSRNYLQMADRNRGRFRSFPSRCCQRARMSGRLFLTWSAALSAAFGTAPSLSLGRSGVRLSSSDQPSASQS